MDERKIIKWAMILVMMTFMVRMDRSYPNIIKIVLWIAMMIMRIIGRISHGHQLAQLNMACMHPHTGWI